MNPGTHRSPLEPTVFTRLFYGWAMGWAGLMTVISTSGYLVTQFFIRRKEVFRWWSIFWAKSILGGTGIRLECSWRGDLDCKASYVFASNHQIMLDIPLMALAIKCPFGFVAKAELAKIPLLGHAIGYSPSVFVDRSNPRETFASMKRAGENIRNGTSVIIFPEGARTYEKQMIPFQKGAFLLALEAGVPLVPVTILDAYDVVNEKRRMARPGVVRIEVGKPIPLEGLTRRNLPELMATVREAIERPLLDDSAKTGPAGEDPG